MARVDALEHELKDVEGEFAALEKGELAAVNGHLKDKGLNQIALVDLPLPSGGGGVPEKAFESLVGLHLFDTTALQADTDEESEDED